MEAAAYTPLLVHVGTGHGRDVARFPRLKGHGYQVISFLETGSGSGEISPSARNDVFSSARRRIARRVCLSPQLQLRRTRTRKQFRGRNKRIESPPLPFSSSSSSCRGNKGELSQFPYAPSFRSVTSRARDFLPRGNRASRANLRISFESAVLPFVSRYTSLPLRPCRGRRSFLDLFAAALFGSFEYFDHLALFNEIERYRVTWH